MPEATFAKKEKAKILVRADITKPTYIKIDTISDDRGVLTPITDYIDDALIKRFYAVENYGTGIIRGLHFHKKEINIFAIVSGAAKFVTVHLPEEIALGGSQEELRSYIKGRSETVQTFVMSSRHQAVLVFPPGFANGWISLETRTILIGASNLRYEEAYYDNHRIDPFVVDSSYWQVKPR